jgi:hypothetical protein
VDRNTGTTTHDNTARIARVAWLCAFVVPLVLATLLFGLKSAQAATPTPGFVPLALEEEEFAFGEEGEFEPEEEAEFAEEECEIANEEAAEGEIGEAEANQICKEARELIRGKAGPSAAGGECPLRSASAHASTHNDKLKITIGYTTNSPVAATIQIHKVGTFKRQLGRSGAIRITKKLGKKQPGRVVVSIKAPSCAKPKISATKVR